MKARMLSFVRDERGASLAVTAVMLVSLLSVIALAFDVGLLYTARAEAQRAADASALAGASVFFNPATSTEPAARQRAYEFAAANEIRNMLIDTTSEVTVTVSTTLRRVHVLVRRQAIPMWFAQLFGIGTAPVAASAMAHASAANTTHCMAPLAMPDWWHDPGDDIQFVNRIPDGTENWQWGNDGTEAYQRYEPGMTGGTGLGSDWRNGYTDSQGNTYSNDQGRIMVIKPQSPSQGANSTYNVQMGPGWFFPIRLANNDDGTTNKGANDYRQSFYNCRSGAISLDDNIPLEMGNMVGPTRQAINEVVCMDPGVHWDNAAQDLVGGQGWASPRVLTFALFPPEQLTTLKANIGNQGGGSPHYIQPNNFGLFLIEPIGGGTPQCQGNNQGNTGGQGNQVDIQGRFLKYASGTTQGTVQGTLILRLQLIQ